MHEIKAVRRKDIVLSRSFYFPENEHTTNIALLRRHCDADRRLVNNRFDLAELPQKFERVVGGERIKPLMMA